MYFVEYILVLLLAKYFAIVGVKKMVGLRKLMEEEESIATNTHHFDEYETGINTKAGQSRNARYRSIY